MEDLFRTILAVVALMAAMETNWAHGFAGKRFFPATLTTDDPFVADEMGTLGFAIPSRSYNKSLEVDEETGEGELEVEANADAFELGFAVQYSLIYLQQNVRDLGLPEFLNHLIPLVEFAIELPVDRGQAGLVTGTVNPGILWSGKSFQIGVEAIIPHNDRTGYNVGVMAQIHFYLNDLLPGIFRPIFGGRD